MNHVDHMNYVRQQCLRVEQRFICILSYCVPQKGGGSRRGKPREGTKAGEKEGEEGRAEKTGESWREGLAMKGWRQTRDRPAMVKKGERLVRKTGSWLAKKDWRRRLARKAGDERLATKGPYMYAHGGSAAYTL
eukprot:6416417-Prymnesium_polylepis.1